MAASYRAKAPPRGGPGTAAVVRHAIRASVESYSIKKLEPLYAFQRTVGLTDVAAVLAKVQASLELGDFASIGAEERTAVEGYNRDDCLSTWRLRDWLENVRSELATAGSVIQRPSKHAEEPGGDPTARQQKIGELVQRLTHNVPLDGAERSEEEHARWLLAHILNWHRREETTGFPRCQPTNYSMRKPACQDFRS
jgi:hypothetical protein